MEAFGEHLDTTDYNLILEQKLSLYTEYAPLAYIEWNLQFEVVEWNTMAEQIFGYRRSEALGRHAAGLIVPESARSGVDAVWSKLVQASGGAHNTNDNVTKSGQVIHCEWFNAPIRHRDGRVLGVASLVQDVTASRRAEAERLRLQDEIIHAQQAALAELSTPLIPINDQIVVMPLVGTMDSRRAQDVLDTLLRGVSSSNARVAILDITGVRVVDTQVANALIRAAQAVQLLGASVLLTGIRPEIAQTLVGLGVHMGGIVTRSTLQGGISYAMRHLSLEAQ